jgi:DnaJ-class molecular chaperone
MRGYVEPPKNTSEQAKKQAEKAYSQKTEEKKPAEKEKPRQDNWGKSINDIFKAFSETFTPPPSDNKNHNAKKTDPKKGEDIITDLNVTIIEAHNGTVRKVNILRTDICPKCGGKRQIKGVSCANCSGKGEVSSYKQLNVKIPAGVKEGSKIKIANEGNRGLFGGENGDLFLLIHILANSHFIYDGLQVQCEIPITPTEAALGADIQVPSVDGTVNMKIPPETRSGQKFKLAGEGLPDGKTGKRGDQIVTVRIEIPPNLTDKEKELYRELGKIRKFNPRENLVFDKQ